MTISEHNVLCNCDLSLMFPIQYDTQKEGPEKVLV